MHLTVHDNSSLHINLIDMTKTLKVFDGTNITDVEYATLKVFPSGRCQLTLEDYKTLFGTLNIIDNEICVDTSQP